MIGTSKLGRRSLLIGIGGLSIGSAAWFTLRKRSDHSSSIDKVMGTIVALNLIDLPTFEHQVVPAYSLYVGSSDTTKLIELLEKAIADYASVVGRIPDLPSREVFQEYSDILAGKIFYSSENIQSDQLHETSASDLKLLINTSIAPALMKIKCVPSNLPIVEQDMSHRHLMMYLYDHSKLVEDYFTFAREPSGSTPPIKLGEWSRLF
jgi:hypothetical protein